MGLNGVCGLVRSCTAASEAEDASEILFAADKTMLDFAWLRFLRGLSRLLCQVLRPDSVPPVTSARARSVSISYVYFSHAWFGFKSRLAARAQHGHAELALLRFHLGAPPLPPRAPTVRGILHHTPLAFITLRMNK